MAGNKIVTLVNHLTSTAFRQLPVMRISDEPVKQFLELQTKLPTILSSFGITQVHIYKGIGMPRATWEVKKRNQTFTIAEMQAICDLINTGKSKPKKENNSIKEAKD